MRSPVAWVSLCGCLCACGQPFLARDGTLIFPENGARGAAIVTANGLEFHDVADVPARIVARDPYEPWRAPIGFLVPASGRFTRTSAPTVVATPGLIVSFRPSDTRVPSWGGEMLVRVDVSAPATAGEARWGEDVAVVIDGRGQDTLALCDTALAQLGARDRVIVLDAADARPIVPMMPASNRSLVTAAIEHRLASAARKTRERTGTIASAVAALAQATTRRLLILSDAGEASWGEATRSMADQQVFFAVVGTSGGPGDREARLQAVRAFVPPAGTAAFGNVVLALEGTPSPSHVLEASGGEARWKLEGGELAFGDVRAGDERTEVVRVTIPAWTPGEPFTLHASARFFDLVRGEQRAMSADLVCAYDDDVERLAESRHGDVIAYASALATLARLDAAFVGGKGREDDVRPLARMHARSLALLARDTHDPAAAAQAAMLEALLGATR